MKANELILRQVDEAIAPVRLSQLPRVPAGGWIRTIRQALGMTTRQLAARVGVRLSTLLGAEKNEAAGTITLNQLRRVAAALECELCYVLIPRESLRSRVERRAEDVARARVADVAHSMALEAQEVGTKFREKQIAELKEELLGNRRSRLWD
ncbi:MAG TPA: mobile mystery protein A [Casimicrobiaceae bacterium]|jgi:predicted DNA-binding mobile mystery protein A